MQYQVISVNTIHSLVNVSPGQLMSEFGQVPDGLPWAEWWSNRSEAAASIPGLFL
jgi:hypothetical protein